MILLAQEGRRFLELSFRLFSVKNDGKRLDQQNKAVIKKYPTLSSIDVPGACLLYYFIHKMCAILQAVQKCFMFIGSAELTTEVPDGIVIIQGQAAHEGVQFLEAVADLRRVGFVGLGVSLVQLIQDGVTVAVARIEWEGLYVGFQSLGDVIHGGTSWRRRASL